MKFLRKHVVPKIGSKWFDVALELLGSEYMESLYVIRENYHNATNCTSEMLKLWLQRNPEASWNQLLKALREVNCIVLAETLRVMLYEGKLISISYVLSGVRM